MVNFPLADYWWFYTGFIVFVLFILSLDLGVFHKKAHEVSVKEASIWTAVWISLALVFNYLFYMYASHKFGPVVGKQMGLEFLTGFVIEKALAVDNIFVFAVVFSYFAIPRMYQHRILFWGIFGALIFRGIFIAIGSALMQYHAVIVFFGILLIFTGLKMIFGKGDDDKDLSKNFIIRKLTSLFKVHPQIEGDKFFVVKNGVRYVTPLFICLIFVELTDIVFAVDSVPAIFSLTKEPLIVFTSNIFAILGLRSMYFMLSGAMDKFKYIKYGLSAVLVFVGLKMVYLNQYFGGHFPIVWSLTIIAGIILTSVVVSVVMTGKNEKTQT